MTLIDLIEVLGPSVDEGLIDMDEAAEWVAEFSGGGLTVRGARDSLRRHRTIRGDYRQVAEDARVMAVVVSALQDATTPGEAARARLAVDVEVTLQRAMHRERLKQRLLNGGFPYSPNGDQQ